MTDVRGFWHIFPIGIINRWNVFRFFRRRNRHRIKHRLDSINSDQPRHIIEVCPLASIVFGYGRRNHVAPASLASSLLSCLDANIVQQPSITPLRPARIVARIEFA